MKLTSLFLLLSLCVATAAPALACGEAPRRERVTGVVVDFDGLPDSVQLKFARPSKILVQYPRFEKSGVMLYQHEFDVVTDDSVWALHDALEGKPGEVKRASIVLEKRDGQWHLVSWS